MQWNLLCFSERDRRWWRQLNRFFPESIKSLLIYGNLSAKHVNVQIQRFYFYKTSWHYNQILQIHQKKMKLEKPFLIFKKINFYCQIVNIWTTHCTNYIKPLKKSKTFSAEMRHLWEFLRSFIFTLLQWLISLVM